MSVIKRNGIPRRNCRRIKADGSCGLQHPNCLQGREEETVEDDYGIYVVGTPMHVYPCGNTYYSHGHIAAIEFLSAYTTSNSNHPNPEILTPLEAYKEFLEISKVEEINASQRNADQ